jgi:transcription initiation factor TFIID subunit TAF12
MMMMTLFSFPFARREPQQQQQQQQQQQMRQQQQQQQRVGCVEQAAENMLPRVTRRRATAGSIKMKLCFIVHQNEQ